MPSKHEMAIENIEATQATQVRTKLNKDVIDQYQQDLEDGAIFPPVVVFAEEGSSRHILADGFHRLIAHVNAEREMIEVEVHVGGMHEALVHALSANRVHGLRRTNSDKINAVKLALKDPAISQHTQQEIADICGVSRSTVVRVGHKDPDPSENVSKTQKPEANTPENNRPTKVPPTQDEIERGEVRQALALLKALPYPGENAGKLVFDGDDIKDLEYCCVWLSNAFIAARPSDD